MSLEFFNRLSAILRVELTEPPVRIVEHLQNERAEPAAHILSLRLEPSVFEDDALRPLSEQELARIAFDKPEIRLRGLTDHVVVHRAPNGASFSVRDLLAAVEETERQTRGQTAWFGGVDVHHRFFEGIRLEEDGVWAISWGS